MTRAELLQLLEAALVEQIKLTDEHGALTRQVAELDRAQIENRRKLREFRAALAKLEGNGEA